tara:strand:- start:212 stop:1222 length:1011 start_codon:yes stop_codon:yes gene_type:complete
MNKLIAILLLSTVTCFGGSKFVSGNFVRGAMPAPIVYPDLIVNGTTLTIAANATYNYNNIILTNGGILQIANTNVLGWTIINCNKLKVYSGSVIIGGYFTKWDQSSPTVTKTAPDGTLLSAVFQPHTLNTGGIAGGAGGADGASGDPNYSATEFNGASGGDGNCDYAVGTLLGGAAGTVSNSGDGGFGQSFGNYSTTCGYYLNGSGGGGGRAGYSSEFIYLNIKQYFEPSINTIVQLGGEKGYTGGDSGDCNFANLDYFYMGYGGGGGAGGNGGALVVRKPTEATINCEVYEGDVGEPGYPGLSDYYGVCYDSGGGGSGETGQPGIAGSLTFLNSL